MDNLILYDFENRDDQWGTTYGVNLLYKFFPEGCGHLPEYRPTIETTSQSNTMDAIQ